MHCDEEKGNPLPQIPQGKMKVGEETPETEEVGKDNLCNLHVLADRKAQQGKQITCQGKEQINREKTPRKETA